MVTSSSSFAPLRRGGNEANPSAMEFLSATLRFDPEQRVAVTEALCTCSVCFPL